MTGCAAPGYAGPAGREQTRADELTVALCGNPNTGKSTLFNTLTGGRAHVGNWPGKTVERQEGVCRLAGRVLRVVDLPGIYSLNPWSEEGRIARDYLLAGAADALVLVVDATNLERNLYLVLQSLLLFPRCVVVLNLMDAARRSGLMIDTEGLACELGAPVVPLAAARGEGLPALLAAVAAVARQRTGVEAPAGGEPGHTLPALPPATELYVRAHDIATRVVAQRRPPDGLDERFDRLVTNRWLAFPLMLAVLAAVFWLTMFGAAPLSAALGALFAGLAGWARAWMAAAGAPGWLAGALVDGLIVGVGAVVSVMLPTMAIFFVLFALIEDAGFIPRIAFVMDRMMRPAGTEGKHCLTCLMAYGCNIPGVLSTRILSGKHRLIAILTNALNPCNGRLGPMLALCQLFFGHRGALVMAALLLISIAAVLFASFVLSATVLRGEAASFVMEMPPYRRPTWRRVVTVLSDRVWATLWRATVVAVPATLLIWMLANYPAGASPDATWAGRLSGALDHMGLPLGLPPGALTAAVFALPAKEVVVAALAITSGLGRTLAGSSALDAHLVAAWTPLGAFTFLTFYMLYMPCLYTWVAIHRETRSLKWTVLGVGLPLALAVLFTAGVHRAGLALGLG